MGKRKVIGAVVAGLFIIGLIGSSGNGQPSNNGSVKSSTATQATEINAENIKPICDGKTVTGNCVLESVNYKTYVYHPAVAEKTHTETITTYKEVVTSYCTLCNDGTYSPSCATGRGTCSHHDGVAQWNAPRTSQVPVNTTKTVVDVPAKEAYYEKVAE